MRSSVVVQEGGTNGLWVLVGITARGQAEGEVLGGAEERVGEGWCGHGRSAGMGAESRSRSCIQVRRFVSRHPVFSSWRLSIW